MDQVLNLAMDVVADVVMLPPPDGATTAVRSDFAARRTLARRLGAGHPGLTTIAVATQDGGFLLGGRTPGRGVRSGHWLAEALGDLPAWGGDIRVWFTWPDDPALVGRLNGNLAELGDTVGATVWAPPPGGEVRFVEGCADLGAVDRLGQPGRWHHHMPSGLTGPAQFESDTDGRLVPVGGPVTGGHPGIALFSVAPEREADMAGRYARLRPTPGLFVVDLDVLGDGRLATARADGSLMALGPNECRLLLAGAGWWDEDIVLLCPGDPERPRHARVLFDGLGVDVWGLPPGATIEVGDGAPRAVGTGNRPVRWQRLTAPGPGRPGRWYSEDGSLVPSGAGRIEVRPPARHARAEDQPITEQPAQPAELTGPLSVLPEPQLGVPRGGPRLRVPSLPGRPKVNTRPCELYIHTDLPPHQVAEQGVPSPDLFLLGSLSHAIPGAHPSGYLLRVLARPGAAVDVASTDLQISPTVYLAFAAREVYLLPAARLDRVQLLAGYALSPAGAATELTGLEPGPLRLRCAHARHGVDGLPNEAPRWPDDRPARAYALVPSGTPPPDAELRLYRRPPAVRPDCRLLELEVPRREAIDVRAAATQLTPLTSVRSRVPVLRAAGVDLVLPVLAGDRVTVTQILVPQRGRWRHRWRRTPTGQPRQLSTVIADG